MLYLEIIMASVERIERKIADMKHQMETPEQKETQPKRSGYFGLIGVFIIGFILGLAMGYLLLA
jgi:F0F1-type ATP synthase assembly protein I